MRADTIVIYSLTLLIIWGCQVEPKSAEDDTQHEMKHKEAISFDPQNKENTSYDLGYFSGKAEISTYELSRARYDGIHPGEAVLIFVTEPFLANEQVKLDNGNADDRTSVLKLNKIERFTTGLYDYSMFTSVFTPLEKFNPEHPLKVSFSSQDWCGQVFAQLNNSSGYTYQQNSYFQSEGDTTYQLDYAIVEDNLFNLARVDEERLPINEFEILPSQSFVRTAHVPYKPYKARGSIAVSDSQIVYNYEIPELKRSVRIFMDPKSHNRIVKWTETYPTVFDGKLRTSEYLIKDTKQLPYWRYNSPLDDKYRDSLQVETVFSSKG